eukprot:s2415_g2.t1
MYLYTHTHEQIRLKTWDAGRILGLVPVKRDGVEAFAPESLLKGVDSPFGVCEADDFGIVRKPGQDLPKLVVLALE